MWLYCRVLPHMSLIFPCCHKLFEPDWDKCYKFIEEKQSTQQEAMLHPKDQAEAMQTEPAPSQTGQQGDYAKLATH